MAFDALPSGVRLLPDLITPDQETALVAAIDAGAWVEGEDHRYQQFGWWRPDLVSGDAPAERFLGALPDWAAPLVQRLHVLAPFDYAPDHLVVREVVGGQNPHFRRGEGRTVAKLTLLADLPMLFRRLDGTGTWHLTQARRSLLVLTERFESSWDRTILPVGPLPEGQRLLTLGFRRITPA